LVHPGTRPRRPLAPVAFRPPRALGVITGGFLAAWAAAVGALALTIALGSAAEFKTFVAWVAVVALLGIAVLFTSWTYCLATLTYVVERDTLTIRWGMRRVVIPIDTILRMVPLPLPGRNYDRDRLCQDQPCPARPAAAG
jgi:membrane protein YdbS with pleckstrin-like domain